MRVLFATLRPYLPESVSGAELCTDTLLTGLVERQHACELVTAREPGLRGRFQRARARLSGRFGPLNNSYVVFRAPEAEVLALFEERVHRFAPDIVITHLKGSEAITARALQRGLPVAVMVRDAQFEWDTGGLPRDPRLLMCANSHYVASRVRERFGIEPQILLPLIRKERFRAPRRRADFVTFVNPIGVKGLKVALGVAREMPHRHFQFVENWDLPRYIRAHLASCLTSLPNLELLVPRHDMRPIYGRTAALLTPSQWQESFPRVVIEAHLNGIPVVASDVGGMREALGEGGILLPHDAPIPDWVEALEAILSSPQEQARLAELALRNANRPELDSDNIVDQFVALAAPLVAARSLSRRP